MDETEAEAGQSKPKLYSSASPKCSADLVSAIVAYIDTRRDRDMLEPTASEDQSVRSKHCWYCELRYINKRICKKLKAIMFRYVSVSVTKGLKF